MKRKPKKQREVNEFEKIFTTFEASKLLTSEGILFDDALFFWVNGKAEYIAGGLSGVKKAKDFSLMGRIAKDVILESGDSEDIQVYPAYTFEQLWDKMPTKERELRTAYFTIRRDSIIIRTPYDMVVVNSGEYFTKGLADLAVDMLIKYSKGDWDRSKDS